MQEHVQAIAREWTEFANVTFEFVSNAPSDVRVRVGPPAEGSWSYLGTDALAVSPQQPTMSLEIESLSNADVRFAVLHEFGHVLGLLHETNNPNAEISWDRETVILANTGWSREQLKLQYFTKANIPAETYRPFDPLSVMWYRIPDKWLKTPIEQRTRSNLSESDRQFISILYPH